MEFIKNNWMLILAILAVASVAGLWGRTAESGKRAKDNLNDARDRIAILEDSLSKSTALTGQLEEELGLVRDDYSKLGKEHKELRDSYFRLRDDYISLESGTSELIASNDRSLELVRRGLEILEENEND